MHILHIVFLDFLSISLMHVSERKWDLLSKRDEYYHEEKWHRSAVV